VGLKSLKSLNLTNGYPNKNKKNNNNKVKSKPLELFELAGKNLGGLHQAVQAVSKNRPKYPMLDIPFKFKVCLCERQVSGH
jgi:hypothetical protein